MNFSKPINSFGFRSIFLVMLSNVLSSVLHQPDTKNGAQLHAASFSDHLNFSIAKFDKPSLQFGELKTKEINIENPIASIQTTVEINGQDLTALNLTQTLETEIVSNADDTVCYNDLGCVTRFSFADPLLWPINMLPEPRNKIDTHFTLNTRDQLIPAVGIRIFANDTDGITAASFKATRPTKFYTHGWLSTGYEELYKVFVQRLLANGDFNVIVVHWGGGALTTYDQAFVNIRLVGLEIAFLVNALIRKLGVKASDVHLIGHSLGAHTSGYAGEKIPNLGRITGLDPAGWYFRGMPTFVRLDPTDAQFVDAVHTDGEGAFAVGLLEPVGHVDFYPNGGAHQPGCPVSNLLQTKNISYYSDLDNDTISTICNHMRAIYLYSESFLSDSCQSIGYKCPDYQSFEKGECTSCGSDNNQCAPFGLQTIVYPIENRVNVKFYFLTGESFPYCRYVYAVNVSLAKPWRAKPTISGIIKLSVSGQAGTVSNVQLPASNFEYGSDRQFIVTTSTNLGPIKKTNLSWNYMPLNLLDLRCIFGFCDKRLYVNSVTVSSMNIFPEENIIANTFKMCPESVPGIIGSYFSLELNVNNSCSGRFNMLNYFWPWNRPNFKRKLLVKSQKKFVIF